MGERKKGREKGREKERKENKRDRLRKGGKEGEMWAGSYVCVGGGGDEGKRTT